MYIWLWLESAEIGFIKSKAIIGSAMSSKIGNCDWIFTYLHNAFSCKETFFHIGSIYAHNFV
jgi:hypothetical protein